MLCSKQKRQAKCLSFLLTFPNLKIYYEFILGSEKARMRRAKKGKDERDACSGGYALKEGYILKEGSACGA